MDISVARPLETNVLVSAFLMRALGYKKCEATSDLAVKVAAAEVLLARMAKEDTLTSSNYRNPSYSSDSDRKELREKIFLELIQNKRLQDDDSIAPGVGGVAPTEGVEVKCDRQAVILIGLPASGKSTVSNAIADNYGAFIVDSDYAKRKFPEYKESYGAALVHEESSVVTFGRSDYYDEHNVLEYCISEGINIVIPKIGHNHEAIQRLRDFLIKYGYSVHLVLIKADRFCSVRRALKRFEKTNRYVPVGLIFDGYSNDPILSYYYICKDKEWSSIGVLSTDSDAPLLLESTYGSPVDFYR